MDGIYVSVGMAAVLVASGEIMRNCFKIPKDDELKIQIMSIGFLSIAGVIFGIVFLYCACFHCCHKKKVDYQDGDEKTEVISYHMDNNNDRKDSNKLNHQRHHPGLDYDSKEMMDKRMKIFNRRMKICSFFIGVGFGFVFTGIALTGLTVIEIKAYKNPNYNTSFLKYTISIALGGFLLSGSSGACLAVLKSPPYDPIITPYLSSISTISHYSEGYQYEQPDYTQPPPFSPPPLPPPLSPIKDESKSIRSFSQQKLISSHRPSNYYEHI